ncbi:unnamed protein product [Penicillium bialowiezense]
MESLEQPVSPGDLLLLYGGNIVNEAGVANKIRPYVLLVTSILDTSDSTPTPSSPVSTVESVTVCESTESVTVCESPMSIDSPEKVDPRLDVSAILVRRVPYAITPKDGCWTLDGPDVDYSRQDGETRSSFFPDLLAKSAKEAYGDIIEDDERFPKWASIADSNHCLGDFMPPGAGVKLIIDIHGRDILEHYFGCCPWCWYDTHMCPGCGGVSMLWPELFATCGRDQACPVCMGLAFAEQDKGYLDELDYLQSCIEVPRDFVDRALDLVTDRFERIQARQEELGYLNHQSAKESLQEWMDYHLSR